MDEKIGEIPAPSDLRFYANTGKRDEGTVAGRALIMPLGVSSLAQCGTMPHVTATALFGSVFKMAATSWLGATL